MHFWILNGIKDLYCPPYYSPTDYNKRALRQVPRTTFSAMGANIAPKSKISASMGAKKTNFEGWVGGGEHYCALIHRTSSISSRSNEVETGSNLPAEGLTRSSYSRIHMRVL